LDRFEGYTYDATSTSWTYKFLKTAKVPVKNTREISDLVLVCDKGWIKCEEAVKDIKQADLPSKLTMWKCVCI